MFKKWPVLFLVVACSVGPSWAQSQDRASDIRQWATPNGARVVFLAAPEIPMVDISIDVDAGSRWDPADRAGLASMTQSMMSLGIKAIGDLPALSEVEISESFAELAVQRGGSVGLDRASMTMRTLADADVRASAAKLLARLMAHPRFDAEILEREKKRSIAAVRESMTQPQSIATKALWASMYGGHPYGKSSTPESIAVLTAQDLVEFHAKHWQPSRMRITIVGALTEPQARELVTQILGHASQEAAAPIRPIAQQPAPVAGTRGSRQAIAHPASQSHVWLGMPALGREDPDFFAMTVGNYILGGGGFVSRLTEEIREKRGLSYSVFSAFSPLAQPGPFLIGLQTQTSKAPEALKVVEDTLARFLKEGPNEKEIKAAKQNLIGGFALRVDTNRKLLDNLAQINYYDLPLDYLKTWTQKIDAVTAADIRRVMNRVIRPADLSVVVVAGPAEFQP
jgi:zinc protease